MLFKEFGRKDGEVIVLMHGGGLSWWAWKDVINLLKADYCIICPVIDGHGEDGSNTFISIENSASKLIAMIDEIHGGRVHALCGVSLGAQIACEALAQKFNVADFAVIESALVIPSKLTAALIIPAYNLSFGLVQNRRFSKAQAKAMLLPPALFEQYFEDSKCMLKQTFINLAKSNNSYTVHKDLSKTIATVLIVTGNKETRTIKKSAKLLHETIQDSTVYEANEYHHGEFSLSHPEEYVQRLRAFLNDDKRHR